MLTGESAPAAQTRIAQKEGQYSYHTGKTCEFPALFRHFENEPYSIADPRRDIQTRNW